MQMPLASLADPKNKFMEESLPLGKYKHYKGKMYEVIGVAKHSETPEELGVYHALDDRKDLWVRPVKMFLEEVEVDGKKVRRFEFIK